VTSLLKAIETGEAGSVGYINPNKYLQHNPAGDGLAGFGAVPKALPDGFAKGDTVREFRDGDYLFAHTEYNFVVPEIGFDIFRYENGKIAGHWDTIEAIPPSINGSTTTASFKFFPVTEFTLAA